MTESLPVFRYHPDPVATGSVEKSDGVCGCCGRQRGYVYAGTVYGAQDVEAVCPWCIANGAAASLGASFSDSHVLRRAGIAADVVAEVSSRTPGYSSWQPDEWLVHCGDACEFHGDASVADVVHASQATLRQVQADSGMTAAQWGEVIDGYCPGGSPAVYKFVCRHCRTVLFGWDCH